jgi:hypothetical protein
MAAAGRGPGAHARVASQPHPAEHPATSVIGWPDLVMWSEAQRRVLYVELKSETGKLSFEQDIVLDSLRAAGCETFVWRPSDLEQVRDVLQGVAA